MKGFIKKSNYYCWKEICDNSFIFAIFGVERFIMYVMLMIHFNRKKAKKRWELCWWMMNQFLIPLQYSSWQSWVFFEWRMWGHAILMDGVHKSFCIFYVWCFVIFEKVVPCGYMVQKIYVSESCINGCRQYEMSNVVR